MSKDIWTGCANFRDVGEFVNLISGHKILPENRLYRGGRLDFIQSAADIHYVRTIINLRNSRDANTFGAVVHDFPTANDLEKYHTENREVRAWLNAIFKVFEDENLAYPVLIHCNSGKDRSGVVIAALLLILGILESIIVEEYLLSDGEVKQEWISGSIQGIGLPEKYFNRIDLDKVRKNILHI